MRQKIKERSLTRRSKTSVDLSRHRERQFGGREIRGTAAETSS
jgi:hypothetical protein